MKKSMTDYLEKTTGKPWRKTDRLYLQFKTRAGVFPQFCVFTPDDYPRQPKAMCQFYLPAGDPKVWYQPRRFLTEYLNAKQQLVKHFPWVEFDLTDISLFKGQAHLTTISAIIVINYKVNLTGKVLLKKIDVLGGLTLSLEHISLKARKILNHYLKNTSVKFNWSEQKLALNITKDNNFGEVTYKLIEPNQIEAEFVPKASNLKTIFHGWELIGKLGYSVKGDYQIMPRDTSKSIDNIAYASDHKLIEHSSEAAIFGLIALIIFTDGAAAPFIFAGG